MKITTLIGSSRANGNSEQLADYVTKNLVHKKIYLKDLFIQPIEDLRHTEQGFHDIDDDYEQIIQAFEQSDVVIFATPIYWYGMSGSMKNMVDRLSHAIRDTRYPNFKERLQHVQTIVIAVGGDEPRIKGLPLIQQFHYIFAFLQMPFSAYILGEANTPGAINSDRLALAEAALLNEQLKKRLNENKSH